MQQSCSIFCLENDQAEVLKLATFVFGERAAIKEIRSGLRIQLDGASLTLNFLSFRRRADKFSTTRGNAYFFFDRAPSSNEELKKSTLEGLLKCNLIIGIVAKPTLDHDPSFVDLVFRIAINLNGYVFDGVTLVDALGKVLLPS